MSRSIEFRAWTGHTMMYQDKQYLGSFIRRVVTRVMLEHDSNEPRDHESYLPAGTSIDDYLQQYTGITDKHDNKIYQDDIVRFQSEEGYKIGQVVYGKHNAAISWLLSHWLQVMTLKSLANCSTISLLTQQ